MAIHATQRSFSAGELGPMIDSRADLDKWRSGLSVCKNFILNPAGPLRRRMGTKFVAAAKYPDRECRLIGFQASRAEGYCIELGHLYMRFHRNGLPVLTLGLDPYEIATPWTEDQIFDVQMDGVNDLLFMVHEDHPVQILKFFSELDWTIEPMEFDWPTFQDENITPTTLTISDLVDVPVTSTIPFVVTAGAADILSGTLISSGARSVVVNSLDVDPVASPGAYLKLQGSIDGGGTWTDLQTYTVPGTYAGTYTGTLRLIANFYTVNATLSTTVNNPQISKGDTMKVTSSTPIFTPQSVGRYYSIGHQRDDNEIRISLRTWAESAPLKVIGDWTVTTTGTWQGFLFVERSLNDGLSWETVIKRYADEDRNISYEGNEKELVLLRLRFQLVGNYNDSSSATLEASESLIEGVFEVTSFISSTQVNAVVIQPILNANPTRIWRKGAWSAETGFPRTVQWHANRMVFGGTKEQGAAIWFSAVEDYYDFRYGIEDSDAFFRVLGGTQQESIQWMCSRGDLGIGTSGGEWIGASDEDRRIVTPASFSVFLQSNYGGEGIPALVAGNAILYVQSTGRKLREFTFSLADDSYNGADLNQLATHITRGGIRDIALQRQRDTTLWTTNGFGEAPALIYDRAQQVVGWARHTTRGAFESVATVFESGEEDSVYFSVRREINGETVRYIERMVPNQLEMLDSANISDMPFMDSYAEYNGTTTSPGFTTFADFKEKLDALTVVSSLNNVNCYAAIKGACDNIVWSDDDPTVTKVMIVFVDTPNAGISPTSLEVLASLNDNNIVLSWGPNFPGENYSSFSTITGGEVMTEAQLNTQSNILAKLSSLFTPNDKLELCIIIDKLATPADAINFQTIIASLKLAITGLNTHLMTKYDSIGYSLVSMNAAGYVFETTASASTATVVSGLDHLVGESVQILADGVDIPEQIVSGAGTITLEEPAVKVFVGLGYDAYAETLPMTLQLRDGDSQGRFKNINEVILRVWKSVSAEIGPFAGFNGYWEPLVESGRRRISNRPETLMGTLGDLEDWKFIMPGGSDSEACIAVRQTRPFPLNILTIQGVYNVTEK